jgi:uncharacterized membrane protein YvlD (DUF360 family)
VVTTESISTGHVRFVHHGGILYFLWFFIGFLLLATKRYFKFNWLFMHLAHMILGTLVMVGTLVMAYRIFEQFAFHIQPDNH